MIEAGYEEVTVVGELMNWENLNSRDFKDEYSNEKEGTAMLNSGPSSDKKGILLD